MQHPRVGMCSPPDSIPILQILAKLTEARLIVEVGVFTGYATLGMALALPSDGQLIACDISREFTSIGLPCCSRSRPTDVPSAQMSHALCKNLYDLCMLSMQDSHTGKPQVLLIRSTCGLRPQQALSMPCSRWSTSLLNMRLLILQVIAPAPVRLAVHAIEQILTAAAAAQSFLTLCAGREAGHSGPGVH